MRVATCANVATQLSAGVISVYFAVMVAMREMYSHFSVEVLFFSSFESVSDVINGV